MEVRKIFTWILFILLLISLFTLRNSTSSLSLFNHFLGIAGTALIFGADVFYSSRKYGQIAFGKLKWYLQAHVVVGIIGPVLILKHASLSFKGFSGFVLALTIVVVASGFTGRYILRLIPRKMNGRIEELSELESKENALKSYLYEKAKGNIDVKPYDKLDGGRFPEYIGIFFLLRTSMRSLLLWARFTFKLISGNIKLSVMRDLSSLFYQRKLLQHQINFYSTSRNMLSKWKVFHIPLTITLFVTIITHVITVFYYGRFF